MKYSNAARRFPQHLVVFRGGVSEGEYRIIVQKEESAFKEAFNSLLQTEGHNGFKIPNLTIIVVQRNSNYRIVPFQVNERAKPVEQNCRPGTCLDKRVMHPTVTEFLLVGHKAIQGTARPIRCTVVTDTTPERVSLEELENVTYCLCYAHGIVTSPVSIPAPLYSASDLAKRGRNNWKVANFDDEERGSDQGRFTIQPGQNPEHFFINMSEQLQPRIETKFWA
jgi:hypothetical protein